MASRDTQTVILSRQTILLVTAVGVGLLTLCYVLGVQVGKQSAALRHPAARGAGEDLQELPASVADQLTALEGPGGTDTAFQKPAPAKSQLVPRIPAGDTGKSQFVSRIPAGDTGKSQFVSRIPAGDTEKAPVVEVKAAAPVEVRVPPAKEAPAAASDASHWTLQLISTPDPQEAQRMAIRAKAAGFATATVAEKGLYKVRLAQAGLREAMDATAHKLKNRGFKPFAIKTP